MHIFKIENVWIILKFQYHPLPSTANKRLHLENGGRGSSNDGVDRNSPLGRRGSSRDVLNNSADSDEIEYQRMQRDQRKAQQLLVAAAAAHAQAQASGRGGGSMTPVSLAQQMALGGLLNAAAAEDLRLHRGGGGGGGGGRGAAPQTEPLSLSTKESRKGGDFGSSSGLQSPSSISPNSENEDESPSGLNLGGFGRKRPLRTPSPSGTPPPPFLSGHAGHLQPPITSLFNSAFPGGFPHHSMFPRGSPHSPPLGLGGIGGPSLQGDSPGAHGSSASSGQGGHEWTFEEQFKQVRRNSFYILLSFFTVFVCLG